METDVRHDADRSSYDLYVDGERAGVVDYHLTGTVATISHTEVAPCHRGRGLGALLVREALEDLRRRGLSVRPRCPFVARFIEDNPAYRDLLAA
ncbi:MAG: GNAT family N-acetyltransferase [Acidimicrobiia bacterium]